MGGERERKTKKHGRKWINARENAGFVPIRVREAELGRWRGKFTATSIKTVNFPGRHVISGGVLSIGVPGKRHDPSREARQRRCAASAPREVGEGATCGPGCVLEEVCVRISGRSLTSITRATVSTHLYQNYTLSGQDFRFRPPCLIFHFFDSATRSLGRFPRPLFRDRPLPTTQLRRFPSTDRLLSSLHPSHHGL